MLNRPHGLAFFWLSMVSKGRLTSAIRFAKIHSAIPPGAIQVGAGATANTTTLPLQGGSGSFAVGDWLQVGQYLHRVVQVNSGSVDVFPRLRSSYTQGTGIVYTNAVGLFRLSSNAMDWTADNMRFFGLSFSATEVL